VLTGMAGQPDNEANVLEIIEACNGQVLLVDNLLLPANRTSQVTNNYGDTLNVANVLFFNQNSCEDSLTRALAEVVGASSAALLWTGNGLRPLLRYDAL
jgi:hypothetical protein